MPRWALHLAILILGLSAAPIARPADLRSWLVERNFLQNRHQTRLHRLKEKREQSRPFRAELLEHLKATRPDELERLLRTGRIPAPLSPDDVDLARGQLDHDYIVIRVGDSFLASPYGANQRAFMDAGVIMDPWVGTDLRQNGKRLEANFELSDETILHITRYSSTEGKAEIIGEKEWADY